jgi:hypothetical protein
VSTTLERNTNRFPATVLSDSTLVGTPAWILNRANLEPRLRRRIIFVFSISIATTLAAIAHVAVAFTVGKEPSMLCALLEVIQISPPKLISR